MARPIRAVIGGVDTHAATHHDVVVDLLGVLQGSQEFTATAAGYTELLAWLRSHGRVDRVGVEGTGAYGAGLARHLHDKGVSVIEVPRPDRRLRRQRGKSDPIDAEAAARAVLAGTATVKPKLANGSIEAIRAIRVARNGAVKAKTAATNALQALLITAPEPLRAQLRCRSTIKLVETCGGLRPGHGPAARADPGAQARPAIGRPASRRPGHRGPPAQPPARCADRAGCTGDVGGVRPRAGHHQRPPGQHRRQPGPASLRERVRPPLRSGADPGVVRQDEPPPTAPGRRPLGQPRPAHGRHRAAALLPAHQGLRRTADGLSMAEIIRCLKRYLAREVFIALRADYAAITT